MWHEVGKRKPAKRARGRPPKPAAQSFSAMIATTTATMPPSPPHVNATLTSDQNVPLLLPDGALVLAAFLAADAASKQADADAQAVHCLLPARPEDALEEAPTGPEAEHEDLVRRLSEADAMFEPDPAVVCDAPELLALDAVAASPCVLRSPSPERQPEVRVPEPPRDADVCTPTAPSLLPEAVPEAMPAVPEDDAPLVGLAPSRIWLDPAINGRRRARHVPRAPVSMDGLEALSKRRARNILAARRCRDAKRQRIDDAHALAVEALTLLSEPPRHMHETVVAALLDGGVAGTMCEPVARGVVNALRAELTKQRSAVHATVWRLGMLLQMHATPHAVKKGSGIASD